MNLSEIVLIIVFLLFIIGFIISVIKKNLSIALSLIFPIIIFGINIPFAHSFYKITSDLDKYTIANYDIVKISNNSYFERENNSITILTKSGKYLTFDDSNVEIFKSNVNKANVKMYNLNFKSKLKLYLKDSNTIYKEFKPNEDFIDEK